MAAPLADVSDVVNAWRPLNPVETSRATYWLGVAQRDVRRRWPDVDARLASGDLNADDVKHVVVSMVIAVLPRLEQAGARTWSVSAGEESKAVTLEASSSGIELTIEDWMVEIFDGPTSEVAQPRIAAPRPYDLNRVFPTWPEIYE